MPTTDTPQRSVVVWDADAAIRREVNLNASTVPVLRRAYHDAIADVYTVSRRSDLAILRRHVR